MKVLALLFFTFNLPIAIFLYVLYFGGINNATIKDELSRTSIYEKTSEYISTISIDSEGSEYLDFIKKRFSSTYIKSKAEQAIDSTYNWIIHDSSTPPIISFKEVKEDIVSSNPELLSSLEEIKNQTATSNTPDLSQLTKSDFSINLSEQLSGLKSAYGFLKVVFFLLSTILIVCLIGIVLLSHGKKSKLRWIASTFAVSALWGFIVIASNTIITKMFESIVSGIPNEFIVLISPVIFAIVQKVVSIFTSTQGLVSIVFLVGSALLLTVGELTNKNQISPTIATRKRKGK